MVQPNLTLGFVWLLIAVLGFGTFGLRLSFIQLQAWFEEFSPRIERALVFLPATILAALVFPELFSFEATGVTVFLNARVLAGGLAAITAWRTGSMIATIAVGMGVLWTVQLAIG